MFPNETSDVQVSELGNVCTKRAGMSLLYSVNSVELSFRRGFPGDKVVNQSLEDGIFGEIKRVIGNLAGAPAVPGGIFLRTRVACSSVNWYHEEDSPEAFLSFTHPFHLPNMQPYKSPHLTSSLSASSSSSSSFLSHALPWLQPLSLPSKT